MDDFYKYDSLTAGSKGLVFIGDKILVYRRDLDASNAPGLIDLPGGGPEEDESPFDTFKREVFEEFGLTIMKEHVRYIHRYPSRLYEGKFVYFPVVELPEISASDIKFGSEGTEFLLIKVEDYLKRNDIWDINKYMVEDYLNATT